jgi:hypothetical protein
MSDKNTDMKADSKQCGESKAVGLPEIPASPLPTHTEFEAVKPNVDRKKWKSGEMKPSETWMSLSGRSWKGFQ